MSLLAIPDPTAPDHSLFIILNRIFSVMSRLGWITQSIAASTLATSTLKMMNHHGRRAAALGQSLESAGGRWIPRTSGFAQSTVMARTSACTTRSTWTRRNSGMLQEEIRHVLTNLFMEQTEQLASFVYMPLEVRNSGQTVLTAVGLEYRTV